MRGQLGFDMVTALGMTPVCGSHLEDAGMLPSIRLIPPTPVWYSLCCDGFLGPETRIGDL